VNAANPGCAQSYGQPVPRLTITVPDDLHAELNAEAARTGRTVSEILARRARTETRQPIRLPTNPGGLRPGVDLDNSAAVWDLFDGDESSQTGTGKRQPVQLPTWPGGPYPGVDLDDNAAARDLPVDTTGGGVRPGVDLGNSAALYDLLDEDEVEQY
jgi:CopG-like RHH_1 or ribbon-helix-helix domain, RHH_5